MPKTLTPTNAFPTSIPNFPQAGNNEPVAIGPLESAIQAVLNRTENLHVRLLDGETNGVKRIRRFATLAALSAATGFSDGDVADVEGYGRYRLYDPSALPADGLWVLAAAGGGRWVHILNSMRAASSGLATLTSGGRLAQNPQDGSIITAHLANGAVTAPKLAAGAAIANIGYTPVNKAGDTMSGGLTAPSLAIGNSSTYVGGRQFLVPAPGPTQYAFVCTLPVSTVGTWDRILVEIFGAVCGNYGNPNAQDEMRVMCTNRAGFRAYMHRTHHGGHFSAVRLVAYQQADGSVNLYIAADGAGYYAFVARARHIGAANITSTDIPISDFSSTVPSGTLIWDSAAAPANWDVQYGQVQGRYNHAERWSVSGNVGGSGDVSIGADSTRYICRIACNIPSGKSLYLRRVRAFLSASQARVRVWGNTWWTSVGPNVDEDMDVLLAPGGGFFKASVGVYNAGSNTITIPYMDTIWVEVEIR